MDVSFRVPGTDDPEIVVRRPFTGSMKVLVDGVPARRTSRRRLQYEIPMRDGTAKQVEIRGQWRGLRAVVDGASIPLERQLPRWETVLVFLPAVLAVVGGAIGAVIGLVGAAVNARLFQRIRTMPVRVGAALGVTVACAAAYFAVALAVAPLPNLSVGTCFNGSMSGTAQVSAQSARGVDCRSAHDNEVVGTTVHTSGGSFPGQQAIFEAAKTPCLGAFASYVGIAFEASELDMTVIVPTDLTWLKGDRSVACVVSARDKGKLTGSVRGTAR